MISFFMDPSVWEVGSIPFVVTLLSTTLLLTIALKRFVLNRIVGFFTGLIFGGAIGCLIDFYTLPQGCNDPACAVYAVEGLLTFVFSCVGGAIGGIVGTSINKAGKNRSTSQKKTG